MTQPKTKVKTGCQTCKARKVKCDESFPECNRCISASRVCGGYGVWGGGSRARPRVLDNQSTLTASSYKGSATNRAGPLQLRNAQSIASPPSFISSAISSAQDREIFDWYLSRASTMLPGSFSHDFWSHVVVPSTLSEPAVLHAVLALSCTHKCGVLTAQQSRGGIVARIDDTTGRLSTMSLRHYAKAIGHMKPHFSAMDETSIKVALVACVVFMAFDLLRGQCESAKIHLENGLKLMVQRYGIPESNGTKQNRCWPRLVVLLPPQTLVDNWLIDVFTSLQIQFALFTPRVGMFLVSGETLEGLSIFGSIKEAWRALQLLLVRALYLTATSSAMATTKSALELGELRRIKMKQSLLIHDVERWWTIFEASQGVLGEKYNKSFETRKASCVVMAYSCMVAIEAATCLRHVQGGSGQHQTLFSSRSHDESQVVEGSDDSEMLYDDYTPRFREMLTHLVQLRRIAQPPPNVFIPQGNLQVIDMAHSMMDFGWLPLLFFLASKCRLGRIRWHAVRFMEKSFHREGIWDSRLVARAARRIIAIEDGEINNGTCDDRERGLDFQLSDLPQLEKPTMRPTVPVSRRLRDVEMVLYGEPVEKMVLTASFMTPDHSRGRFAIAEYSLQTQEWSDF